MGNNGHTFLIILLGASLGGCYLTPIAPNGTTTTTTQSPTATPSPTPTSATAVKIFFNTATTGSFDAPTSDGTKPAYGSGLQVQRIYNPDNSLLAQGGYSTGSSWPAQWLSGFELGISGSSNTSASNSDCARFTSATETSSCDWSVGTAQRTNTNCSAPTGYFRVSEYDCAQSVPTTGTGSSSDGIYIRATFNRSALGSGENILAVIEYAASAVNPGPANPALCFTTAGGTAGFYPEDPSCSDFAWKVYLKHNSAEGTAQNPIQPFLLFIPPTFASVNSTLKTGGSGVSAKQIYIPLASDSSLTLFQLSRIRGLDDATKTSFKAACSNDGAGGTPANSPLCSGVIFYSITFYRM